jgi:hypothetical protein
MHRLCTQLRTSLRWITSDEQSRLTVISGLLRIKSGSSERCVCLKILNKGTARGMGHEGKRTQQPATLNRRKSYPIIAVERFKMIWGSSLGHWGVVFCNNHSVLVGFLHVL